MYLYFSQSVQVNKQKSNENETLQRQPSQLLKTTQINQSKLGNIHHTTTRPHIPSSKKKHHIECHKGYDLALIAIFPDSPRNTFTVISQENSVRKKKGKSPFLFIARVSSFIQSQYSTVYFNWISSERASLYELNFWFPFV